MVHIKAFIDWVTKKSFPIFIATFVLIYLWWFRLTPWNSQEYCCSNGNYKFGLILLVLYVGSGIFWWLTKNRNYLGMFFHITTIFFLILNSWYVTLFVPRIIDAAKHNGIVYYLVSYYTGPDQPSTLYQLTKWRGMFNYEIQDMDRWVWKGKIFYDQKTNLVNIVTLNNHLSYTDSIPPRYYEHDSRQLGHHLYYVSQYCEYCNTGPYTITMYKCELDNTSCAMLPFQYIGEGEFWFLDINEGTKEIEFYILPPSGGYVLAYSYGEKPRCYIEGCEIFKSTK